MTDQLSGNKINQVVARALFWPAAVLAVLLAGVLAVSLPPWLLLAAVAGLAGLALLLLAPQWALVLLLLGRSSAEWAQELVQFFPGAWYGFNLAGLLNILGVGLAGFFLARRYARGQVLLPSLPLKAYALFLLVALAGIFGSVDLPASVKEWARLAGSLGVALLACEVAGMKPAQPVHDLAARVILLAAVPPVLAGFYQAASGSGRFFLGYLGTQFAYRPQGTFGHPAILASFLILVAALALSAYVLHHRLLPRPLLPGVAAVCLVLLALTWARTEWLGGVVALGVIALLRRRRLLLLGLVAGILLLLLSSSVRERLFGQQASESFVWRQDVWHSAVDLLQPPSLLGAGLDTAPVLLNRRLPHVVGPPHNDYLKMALETGLLGLASWLAWQGAVLRLGWRRFRQGEEGARRTLGLALLAVSAGGLVIGLADNYLSYTSVQWYLWAVVGLLAAPARSPALLPE